MTEPPIALPPSGIPPAHDRLPAWVLVVMVAAIGLNLRASLGSVPPLLDHIRTDLDLSNTTAGLLTSVPAVFMGLAAPIGQRAGTRFGSESATGWLMVVLGVAGVMRLLPFGAWLLFLSTALAGLAMGGASVLMPAFIAQHLPRIRGVAMGIYSTGLALGVAIAAGTSAGLEQLLGGWRPALAAWGGIAAATAAAWALLARRLGTGRPPRTASGQGLPWRSRTAWLVALFSSSQMIVGFSGLAWITPLYLDLGTSPQHAANLFVLFQVASLITMLTLPALTDYTTDRRPLLAIVVMSTIIGNALLIVAPVSLAVPAMTLFGMGLGGGSTLGLVLIIDASHTQEAAERLGAMVLLVAFLSGALGPLVLGVLSDLTGDLRAGYGAMLALSVAALALVARITPGRSVEDEAVTLTDGPPPQKSEPGRRSRRGAGDAPPNSAHSGSAPPSRHWSP